MEQEKRKRRKKRTKKRSAISKVGLFFLILLLVLLLLGITVSAGWLWMNHSGQSRLSQKQEAVPELMQQAESEAESEMMLEAGSIRYHGKVYTYKKDILTFLFLGIDKNGEVKASSNLFKGGQADALFLAVLDPGEKKISVIGINRDTMASMNVYDKNGRYSGRQTAQIALSHAYGDGLEESCENSLDAVSNLFYFLLIDCILMLIVHQLWKKCLPSLYRIFRESRKTLLVADDVFAVPLVMDMKNFKDYSYEFCGLAFLGEKPENGEVGGMSVVAGADDLIDYCKSASLDEVIVAVADTQSKEMKHVLETLAEMGLTIHYRIPVPELSGASQKALTQFGRFYTITYANRFVPVGQLAMKRLLDLVGALVGCVFLGILTVIVGPMIKLESPGPIFFAQKRVGRNGRIFKMYKFRSMYADAEERKKELMAQNEMNGLMFKMENDPRITKTGAFLRKTSLDEFPQFINILKGDMSLVGTRPPTLDEFAQYSPYHKKRLSFRPGLTGMWQVSGRSDITDFEEIVKLDVEYIDNWSFWLDIKILLKTFLEVFTQKGAR